MQNIKLGYGPRFIYLLFFNCPKCNALITCHEHGDSRKGEEELRAKAYLATCECGFNGRLYGSVVIDFVELEWVGN
jgi:hypothetical protein